MYSRPELEFKNRVCMAQMKLRVVVFSMAVALPIWLLLALLQKLGFTLSPGVPQRTLAGGLLLTYIFGVFAIIRRTQQDHGLQCPKCQGLLGPDLRKVTKQGLCSRCGEPIVKP